MPASVMGREEVLDSLTPEEGKGVPFILAGSLIHEPMSAAMAELGVDRVALSTDKSSVVKMSRYLYSKCSLKAYTFPCIMTVLSEAYGGEHELYGIVDYPIGTISEAKNLERLSPYKDKRLPMMLDVVRELKVLDDGVPVIADIVGPLSLASSLMDGKEILRHCAKGTPELKQFLYDLTVDITSYAKALCEAGADIIFLTDPFATAKTLGPDIYASHTAPFIKSIRDEVISLNTVFIMHICSDPSTLTPSIQMISPDYLSVDGVHVIPGVKSICGIPGEMLNEGANDRVREFKAEALKSGAKMISSSCSIDSTVNPSSLNEISNYISGS
ncbi:MAG: hypothetical protein KAR06_03395 [Deltaproteobacteria bacterium]|nr:hypothetical protein [Deltaproteobacteria bacterium]